MESFGYLPYTKHRQSPKEGGSQVSIVFDIFPSMLPTQGQYFSEQSTKVMVPPFAIG